MAEVRRTSGSRNGARSILNACAHWRWPHGRPAAARATGSRAAAGGGAVEPHAHARARAEGEGGNGERSIGRSSRYGSSRPVRRVYRRRMATNDELRPVSGGIRELAEARDRRAAAERRVAAAEVEVAEGARRARGRGPNARGASRSSSAREPAQRTEEGGAPPGADQAHRAPEARAVGALCRPPCSAAGASRRTATPTASARTGGPSTGSNARRRTTRAPESPVEDIPSDSEDPVQALADMIVAARAKKAEAERAAKAKADEETACGAILPAAFQATEKFLAAKATASTRRVRYR